MTRRLVCVLMHVFVCAVMAGHPFEVRAVAIPIHINTQSLNGRHGTLAFAFIDGDTVANNTVVITGAGLANPCNPGRYPVLC
jgi:hypothetical protein